MAGPAPPVPTLCPDSSLAAGQATAIAPHPLPRPWSSPAVVMLTVKLASGVRFSAVDACGVPFYSGQATARLRGRFAVKTPESLLRPSLPSRCTAASPHPGRAHPGPSCMRRLPKKSMEGDGNPFRFYLEYLGPVALLHANRYIDH